MELIIAKPRGFCAGVERATQIVEKTLKKYPPPIYVRHEIVHNKYVVNDFKKKGVIFVEELDEVPNKSTVIFSAHGIPQKVYQEAKEKELITIDATCPLVKKVHYSVARYFKKEVHIILIGHNGHSEVIGTIGQLPQGKVTLVENEKDVENLDLSQDDPIAYTTQTTLSISETSLIIKALKKKYPDIMGPEKGDLCYATTNRQQAVVKIASKVDVFLIVGSSNSSNSNRLREMAEQEGIPAYLIENYKSLKPAYLQDKKIVGISSGASAPEYLVTSLIDYIKENYEISKISEWTEIEEDVHFPLPVEFR